MKHLDDFNEFSSVNENKETSPVEVQVIGKSRDASVSQKKANSNVIRLVDMLSLQHDYKVLNKESKKEEDNIVTYMNILVQLTEDKVKSLESAINKFDNPPFSIVKK